MLLHCFQHRHCTPKGASTVPKTDVRHVAILLSTPVLHTQRRSSSAGQQVRKDRATPSAGVGMERRNGCQPGAPPRGRAVLISPKKLQSVLRQWGEDRSVMRSSKKRTSTPVNSRRILPTTLVSPEVTHTGAESCVRDQVDRNRLREGRSIPGHCGGPRSSCGGVPFWGACDPSGEFLPALSRRRQRQSGLPLRPSRCWSFAP